MTNHRPVDGAMRAQRREKRAMRAIWLERAVHHARLATSLEETLYFTLPGVEATEIEMLVAAGLLKLTETGAVDAAYARRVIGIELQPVAHTHILSKYPGLKLVRSNLAGYLQGTSQLRYPTGEAERFCRARVVNLDLNNAWLPSGDNNEIETLALIQKLGVMHSHNPALNWSLLLTLHGECPWREEKASFMNAAIRAAVDRVVNGRAALQRWLGEQVVQSIVSDRLQDYSALDRVTQQRVLMWVVPAMIADRCSQQCILNVQDNIRYGDPPNAPMVSWVINFTPSTAQFAGDAQCVTCLGQILSNTKEILPTGTIRPDPGATVDALQPMSFAA